MRTSLVLYRNWSLWFWPGAPRYGSGERALDLRLRRGAERLVSCGTCVSKRNVTAWYSSRSDGPLVETHRRAIGTAMTQFTTPVAESVELDNRFKSLSCKRLLGCVTGQATRGAIRRPGLSSVPPVGVLMSLDAELPFGYFHSSAGTLF